MADRIIEILDPGWMHDVDLVEIDHLEAVERHHGPGPHSGTGTEQEVHAGGRGAGFPEDKIREDMGALRKHVTELAYFYDSNGDRYGPIGGDSEYGLDVPDDQEEILKRLNDEGIETSFLHNHPSGGSFSEADIYFAASRGVEEMRIAHPWGKYPEYVMKLNFDSTMSAKWVEDTVLPFFAAKHEEAYSKYQFEREMPERFSEKVIHESQVHGSREAWKAVAEEWPDWFEYTEVERGD